MSTIVDLITWPVVIVVSILLFCLFLWIAKDEHVDYWWTDKRYF